MYKYNNVTAFLNLIRGKKIGGEEGRNSEVWIARDPQLEEMLVLKEITKQSLIKQNIDDFFLESKILNDSSHPHIMPIRYSAEDERKIYIAMPFYHRGSLNNLLDNRALTVREIIKYSLDFLLGLLFIHTKNLVHLDVKPTNIIINDNDRAILTDFGLSRYLDEDGFTHQPYSYRSHRSPESYDTQERRITDDIYQAGLTIYRMCNGNHVFHQGFENLKTECGNDLQKISAKIKSGHFPNRKQYLPHIPVKLIRIINRMIHPDVSKRYNNVLEVMNLLSEINELLDWEYENVDNQNIEMVWKLDKKNSIVKLSITLIEKDILTFGQKYVKSSGNTQQLRQVNKKHTTFKSAQDHIREMMYLFS